MEVQDSGRDLVVESANFAFNSLDLMEEPKPFAEAYNHLNTNNKIKWREAISKEFDDMSAKGVWKKIQKSDMPNSQNCIKSKWILKLSATEFIARGWWRVDIVRYPESIFNTRD
jgi:hypothetical protein